MTLHLLRLNPSDDSGILIATTRGKDLSDGRQHDQQQRDPEHFDLPTPNGPRMVFPVATRSSCSADRRTPRTNTMKTARAPPRVPAEGPYRAPELVRPV